MKRISISLLLLTGFTSGLTACSLLQRSPDSGYADDYERPWNSEQLFAEKKAYENEQAREEFGWANSRPLNDGEAQALNNRIALNRMETRLVTDREKRQYYRYKGAMLDDRERAYFLSLPTVEARERWATNRGYNSEEEGYSDNIAELIEKNDLTVGMSQKAVVESWGDPDIVEVAGNPIYANERWRYSKYISSNEGYQKVDKFLYFEAGRLVGWETN
jgi:hypothetical protein